MLTPSASLRVYASRNTSWVGTYAASLVLTPSASLSTELCSVYWVGAHAALLVLTPSASLRVYASPS